MKGRVLINSINSIVEALAAFAAQKPDKVAVIAERQEITYGALWKEVRGFAVYIRSCGLEKGSRVIVKAKHSIWYVVAYFGVHLAGCVFVPLEKTIGIEGMKDISEQVSASMVISDTDINGGYIMVSSSAVRTLAADNFCEDVKFDFPKSEELCDIIFTTGTTGKSKGVMLTHGAVVAVAENYRFSFKISEDNVYLLSTPLNHAGGEHRIAASVLTGTTAVLLDGFVNFKLFFEYIRDYHVTSMYLPPSAVRMVLLLAAEEMAKYTDQLDFIHTGGSAFPETDMERFRELLPHTRLYNMYGATEAGNSSTLEYSKEKKEVGCIGKPTINSHSFIVDDNRKKIRSSKDHPGLIATSGSNLMSGYYNEPELTKEVLTDGVLYTNDIGYIDEDGYLYVLGRRGDVINIGGFKIAPTEVEDIALRFPGIAECACFAVHDKVGSTVLKLNIVERPGYDIQIMELREHLHRHLEAFKVPKQFNKVGDIPKTTNGKIDRKVLK